MRAVPVMILALVGCSATDPTPDAPAYSDAERCPADFDRSQHEVCGPIYDYGWRGSCEAGVVYVLDLGGAVYCRRGSPEPLCSTVGTATPQPQQTCPNGCAADVESVYIEVLDEWYKLDDLCAG